MPFICNNIKIISVDTTRYHSGKRTAEKMEVLRWNRTMLSLLGFNIPCRSQKVRDVFFPSQDSSRCSLIFKWLKRCYHFSLLVLVFSGFLMTGYLAFTTKQLVVKIFLFAMSFFFASVSGMVIWVDNRLKTRSLLEALSNIVSCLNEKEIEYIRCHDKTGVIARLFIMGLPSLVTGIMYFTFPDQGFSQIMEIFFSNDLQKFISFMAFQITGMFLTWTGHFYWTVETIAKIYAQHSNKVILQVWKRRFASGDKFQVTAEDLQVVQQTLDKYYRFVREINRSLGAIPLSLFATLFVDFVMSVSIVTLFSYINTTFALLGLGAFVANQVIAVVQIVCVASKAMNVIEDAVFMADQLTTIPLPQDVCFTLLECRRSLTVFLQRQTSVVFSAQSTFNLELSVVLSFVNAIVPFTVMFITTIAQMNGDTHHFSSMLNTTTTTTAN